MKKIAIVGCPSSGKTTMAVQLGRILNIPVYHLDKIFWTDDGHLKQDSFITNQEEIMCGDSWIIDGDFTKSKSYEMRLNNADTIIFFAFSKVVVYYRLFRRGIKYFNRLRPDMGGKRKNHLNWALIKFIWNYSTHEECKKVSEYIHGKNLIILHNLKEEREFLKHL
jgi:adenylate kinase family enzyme